MVASRYYQFTTKLTVRAGVWPAPISATNEDRPATGRLGCGILAC
jgi:hypothetical protein